MYHELYEYLILYKQLNIPGVGTFLLEKKPAQTDFTQRSISPAAYSINLHNGNETPPKKFFTWLSNRLDLPYHEAIMKFNGFVFDLKSAIQSGDKIYWNEVGTLSKGISGEVKLEPAVKDRPFDRPVNAVRVIRENAVHTVRVGEQEKTSVEMTELLHPEEARKVQWWTPALIAAIVVVIIIAIYFFQKGLTSTSVGNQQRITPQKPSVTYNPLP
jgi:hypothetical protein